MKRRQIMVSVAMSSLGAGADLKVLPEMAS